MSFWETIQGHRLADVLIRELPKISEKSKQKCIKINSEQNSIELEKRISEGDWFFVGMYIDYDGKTIVIVNER